MPEVRECLYLVIGVREGCFFFCAAGVPLTPVIRPGYGDEAGLVVDYSTIYFLNSQLSF